MLSTRAFWPITVPSTFTFKVTVTNGYRIEAVRVNGVIVEAVEGVYTATITGDTAITVSTVDANAPVPTKAADFSFASKDTGTITLVNPEGKQDSDKVATKMTWVQGDVTFIVNKETSSTSCNNNNGAPYVNPIRIYKNQSIEFHFEGLIKVIVKVNDSSYVAAFTGSTFPEGATVTADGVYVTIAFAEPVDSFVVTGISAATRFDSFEVYKLVAPTPVDSTAPVITISNDVLTALAAKEFMEGADETATFTAFMAGISATDETDGDIAVTQEMINLGGLNPANLVKGDYTITITVEDAAHNEATKEVKIHVKGYANLTLDFMDGTVGSTYVNAAWTQEKYTTDWVSVSGQMNCREKNSVRVVNFTSGSSTAYRYTYNKNGAAIGIANKLTFKVGNYYNAQILPTKVILIDTAGTSHYLVGSADAFYDFPVTDGLINQELTFDAAEIKSIVVVCKSAQNSAYLYVGDLHLTYVPE